METLKIAKYFTVLKTELDKMADHKDITTRVWNMDEPGLQLEHKPGKILARKGSRYLHSPTSGNKETITVIAAINATGIALPPHVIPKGRTIRALSSFNTKDAPDGTQWSVSETGWNKQGIAKLWFTDTFIPNISRVRPRLLILDGHGSHNFAELLDIA